MICRTFGDSFFYQIMNQLYSFPKSEHLCGEKIITHLFTKGNAFIVYPLRVVYNFDKLSDNSLDNILVSVPKKRFKRAVKRNRIKRLMREAFRLNKNSLISLLIENKQHICIAFQYVSDVEMEYDVIENKIKIAIERLNKIISTQSSILP